MQPDANSILAAETSGQGLLVSPEARAFICLLRPELEPNFENIGTLARISITYLLKPANNPPRAQFDRTPGFQVSDSTNAEPGTRNPERIPRLGDLLAVFLHRLWIDDAFALLQHHGILRGCRCAERQARLNALTPRLLAQLEPRLLTLAVCLSWLLFAVVVLTR